MISVKERFYLQGSTEQSWSYHVESFTVAVMIWLTVYICVTMINDTFRLS
jgi:hypothetical protein